MFTPAALCSSFNGAMPADAMGWLVAYVCDLRMVVAAANRAKAAKVNIIKRVMGSSMQLNGIPLV